MFLIVHFLHYNFPDNKFFKQKWHVLLFTGIKLMACVLACGHVMYASNGKEWMPRMERLSLDFQPAVRNIEYAFEVRRGCAWNL